ncbi:hypothetical protein Thiowin_03780 [Thiorhodovibrio winogradskyi]|uniref:Methyltransferase n=1 Tax=Thiorhodovibrio winogradskyi TaxID=77007 RepID=A0ABZ0SDJ5_9GAMM|nr:hypothetical protein [Thiorhodovibrio winogradskyi]
MINEESELIGKTANEGFERVLEQYPWPEQPSLEGVEPFSWSLGGAGRELIDSVIERHPKGLVLEIDAFMGGAARIWLSRFPELRCVLVDTWEEKVIDYVHSLQSVPWAINAYGEEALAEYASLLKQHGVISCVQNNLSEFIERSILAPMTWAKAFEMLEALDLNPTLVVVNRPRRENLIAAHHAFPNAIIAGGDWNWGKDQDYPVRRYVTEIAERRGGKIDAYKSTFVIAEARHGAPLESEYRYSVSKDESAEPSISETDKLALA